MMWRQVSPERLGPSTQVLLLFLLSPNQERLSERDKGLALQETPTVLSGFKTISLVFAHLLFV